MPEWYRDSSALLFRILCFIADFQEPYMLLRYHPDTPLFDERFKNYGYNKVQLFEHLRAMSYRFYIWNNIFAMDIPHPDSKFRRNYISGLKIRASPMQETYAVFQQELNDKYGTKKQSKVCRTVQRSYYSTVLYSSVCCSCPIFSYAVLLRFDPRVGFHLLRSVHSIHSREAPRYSCSLTSLVSPRRAKQHPSCPSVSSVFYTLRALSSFFVSSSPSSLITSCYSRTDADQEKSGERAEESDPRGRREERQNIAHGHDLRIAQQYGGRKRLCSYG